ncbi:hypothetical protein B0I35DRAFT_433226 [Stachybotrys elegans]|uniref:Uncharacterized protein n=1 Tax=Stachybotrys elegans TaxID=80388 RepID=A0A8K0SMY7_9HYPO|nr:hypothetical protein B0I35DRAFT_433226 [Stachybotrys elegans]
MPPSSIPPEQRPTIASALPTPTYAAGGSWSITCSARIRASLAVVVGATLDTSTYPAWNAFCPSATVDGGFSSAKLPAAVCPPPPGLDPKLAAGTLLTLDAHLGPGDASSRNQTALCVSCLEQFTADEEGGAGSGRVGVRLAWRTRDGGLMNRVLRAERVQEFVEDGDGGVEYACWETFHGLLAPVVKMMVGTSLLWGFGAWMDGLKEYTEKFASNAAPP